MAQIVPIGGEMPQAAVVPIGADVPQTSTPDFHLDVEGHISALDQLLGFLKESTASVNPSRINQAVQSTFWHPVDTAKQMLAGRQALSTKASEAYGKGDYVTAAAKGLEWLIPFIGERMSESGDLLEQGKYGEGLGAAVDAGAQIVAPEIARKGTGLVRQGMQAKAPELMKSSAQDITEALSPTRHRTKVKTARITPGIQERGLTGTLEELRDLAGTKVDEVGPQIEAVLRANKHERVNLAPVRKTLAKMKATTQNEVPAMENGQPTTTAAVHNPRKHAQVSALENLLAKYGDDMSVEQAVAVRQTWDDIVQQAGGFDEKAGRGAFGVGLADQSEAAVKLQAAGALRRELGKAVPDVRALNREFSFWRDLQDVTTASASRKVGQRKTGLLGKTVENTGRAVGGYIGYETGGVVGATTGLLVGGETAKRLTNLFHSPKWKLTSSALKVRLADALATRNPTTIGDAIAAVERTQPAVQAAARETVARLPKAADRQDETPTP